jgi:hypothetical protein
VVAAVRNEVRALDPEVVVFGVRTMEAGDHGCALYGNASLSGDADGSIRVDCAVDGCNRHLRLSGVRNEPAAARDRCACCSGRATGRYPASGDGAEPGVGGYRGGGGQRSGADAWIGGVAVRCKAAGPTTFAVVAAVLVGAVLAASFIPARRAIQVPPGVAMGGE